MLGSEQQSMGRFYSVIVGGCRIIYGAISLHLSFTGEGVGVFVVFRYGDVERTLYALVLLEFEVCPLTLVDIHSQHQNLLLQKDDFQLSVVDIIANNNKELQQYRTTYREYSDTKAALKKLEEQIAANRANEDFLRYQAKELTDANLVAGELSELEQEVETLSHTEDIKTALYSADETFSNDNGGIISSCKSAISRLSTITEVYPPVRELADANFDGVVDNEDILALENLGITTKEPLN